MVSSDFNPGEAIDLCSSDIEPAGSAVTKKRALEDASDASDASDPSSPTQLGGDLRGSKRARTSPLVRSDASLSSEEGEIDEEDMATEKGDPSGTQVSGSATQGEEKPMEKPPKPAKGSKRSKRSAGWNPGISKTVIRTSLGAPTPAPNDLVSAETPPTELPVYEKDSISFALPELADKKGSWFKRFQNWAKLFQEQNSSFTHAITPALVQNAYAHFIDNFAGLKPKKRRSAKQAAREIESTGVLGGLLQSIQPAQPAQPTVSSQDATKQPSGRETTSRPTIDEEDTSERAGQEASASEEEYEPWTRKPEEAPEVVPSANEWASLLDNSTHTNGITKPSEPQPTGAGREKTGNVVTRKGIPEGINALEQQRKYFPSASDPASMCLLCGRQGHTAPNCPTLFCRFCGSNDHADHTCPSRVRCTKCRQLGHQKSTCVEKLAMTTDDGLCCSICNSAEHLEKDCTDEWRSFHPEAGLVHKVTFIPASCSVCGSKKHFCADCQSRSEDAANPTWSLKNRDRYVDPECGLLAIEESVGEQEHHSTGPAPELRIRGHAERTANVHYSESDDSDVEFLGKRAVKQRAPLGQIRMASNIQMPQNATSRETPRAYSLGGAGQTSSQPPLPPGPPPPGLSPHQESFPHPPPPGIPMHGSRPLGPPPSLPAKPPTSNRDYRNVPPPPQFQPSHGQSWQQNDFDGQRGGQRGGRGGRGSRGGRGGGRGRGRGRGRGK